MIETEQEEIERLKVRTKKLLEIRDRKIKLAKIKAKEYSKKYFTSEYGKKKIKEYKQSEKGRLIVLKSVKKYRERIRYEVIKKLGGKCNHCGYKEYPEILQIDHVNGGGTKELRKIGTQGVRLKIYKDKNFEDEYQLLCPTCNWVKKLMRGEKKQGKNPLTF